MKACCINNKMIMLEMHQYLGSLCCMLLMMLDDPLKAVLRPQLRPWLPPKPGRAADGLFND